MGRFLFFVFFLLFVLKTVISSMPKELYDGRLSLNRNLHTAKFSMKNIKCISSTSASYRLLVHSSYVSKRLVKSNQEALSI